MMENHEEYLKICAHVMFLHKKLAVTKHINWLITQITDPNADIAEIIRLSKELLDIVFDENEFKKED